MALETAPLPVSAPRAEIDELTLARAQRGDARACRDLVERYQRPVFAVLSRMLVGHADRTLVEDLAQDTFLRVFRALPGFRRDGPARLSTWILTIASRLAVDALRRQRPMVPMDAAAGVHAPQVSDVTAGSEQRRRALSIALDELTEETRALLVLQVFHDVPYAELAEEFGMDVGTVKSRLSRARAQLRARLVEVAP